MHELVVRPRRFTPDQVTRANELCVRIRDIDQFLSTSRQERQMQARFSFAPRPQSSGYAKHLQLDPVDTERVLRVLREDACEALLRMGVDPPGNDNGRP